MTSIPSAPTPNSTPVPVPTGPTTTGKTSNVNNNNSSCSQLDLSWLNESVLEAALDDNKNLSLSDLGALTSGLQAASKYGSLTRRSSLRLATKIHEREDEILAKLVRKEFVFVVKKLQIYRLLKTHKTWEQVHYMADMHGQGAYILMKDFSGLAPDDVKLALMAFYNHLKINNNTLPFSASADSNIQHLVAVKLCRAYQKLLTSLQDTELGGYDPSFLEEVLQYKAEDLMAMWNISQEEIHPINPAVEAEQEKEETKILGDKTDDEDSDNDDDGNNKYNEEEDDMDDTYRSYGDNDDPYYYNDHDDWDSHRHAGRY